jgi:hypothetical protein
MFLLVQQRLLRPVVRHWVLGEESISSLLLPSDAQEITVALGILPLQSPCK